jgi:hypothetical protein
MENLDYRIALATLHVERGRIIVKQQRDLTKLRPNTPGAFDLLAAFERSQAIFEDDLARFIKQRDG